MLNVVREQGRECSTSIVTRVLVFARWLKTMQAEHELVISLRTKFLVHDFSHDFLVSLFTERRRLPFGWSWSNESRSRVRFLRVGELSHQNHGSDSFTSK